MEQKELEQNKEEFLKIARENIKREGLEELLKWLSSTDFFDAPASTKFHMAEAGGLCKHSINVYNRLLRLARDEWGEENLNHETIAIVASEILKTFCSVNFSAVIFFCPFRF